MKTPEDIKVLFVAGFGPIVRDSDASRKLYRETLGISFHEEDGGYLHTGDLEGVKHFALWPLSHAAQNCFSKESWPEGVPVPQAWVEFEVENVEQATAQLQSQGYRLLVTARKEPWGQTVTRFLGPEGLLVGVTCTPWMRTDRPDTPAPTA
jgi:catechol 2,3-dioxygenase-like lactoylglutathione lyase family enzyme